MSKLIKCKICGDTEFTEVDDLLQCRSCKHKAPKPKDNAELLERANNLRFETKSFDDAAALYEEIIRMTPDEAEAYWGRVLCRYGIEYVKDSNGKYLPTCHRTIESSILDDADYKMAIVKAESGMSAYYTAEAQTIDAYQKKIKLIAAKEEPYDVFISFKATDDYGSPTEDSLLAQELYYYLTKNLGLKVFFSNITLKDKAGQEYEPIIYAALSSATVMVLVGTKPEYINATWVKNEWSRYIAMIAAAKKNNKAKYIVTALKGMKPEQLPSTLALYQAVNLADLGAKEKLCSNIDGLIGDLRVKQQSKIPATLDATQMLTAEAQNLCNLGFQNITLGDTIKAGEYFQKALEKQSGTSLAFWGKLLISQNVSSDEALSNRAISLRDVALFKLAMETATAEEKMRYERVAEKCDENVRRADAKTRHNAEYRSEIEQVKYNYATNLNGEEPVSINETADNLFKDYLTANETFNNASENAAKYSSKKSISVAWLFVSILLAVFILIPGIGAESFVTKLDNWFVDNLDYSIVENFDAAGVSVFDLLSADSEEIAQIIGMPEDVQDTFYLLYPNGPDFGDFTAEALMLGIPLLLFCFIVVFWLLKKFLNGCLTFIITVALAPTFTGLLASLVLNISVPTTTNWIIVVGGGLVGLCVLMLVLGIMKNSRIKGIVKDWEGKRTVAFQQREEAFDKLVTYSATHIDEINNKYYAKYGNEIDNYECNYNIAIESLNASEEIIKRCLGIDISSVE